MVIIVDAGAVALERAAKTNENAAVNLKAKKHKQKTMMKAAKASNKVIIITFQPAFFKSLILKN